MGFVSGFTGGVTLTLSVAYLSVLAHQRNRERQSQVLRAQALAVAGLIDPIPAPLPPSRAELAAAQRATSIEAAKDRWNAEVENAVAWVQRTDWDEVRETAETGLSNLWAKATGSTVEQSVKQAKAQIESSARQAKTTAKQQGDSAAAAAQEAYTRAKEEAKKVELSAEDKFWNARLKGENQVAKLEDETRNTATEAKGFLGSAFERGKEKAWGMVDKAKATTAAVVFGEKASSDVVLVPTMTDVQKALQQRYEKPKAAENKTVAEVLRARYTPVDEQDHSNLRGL